MSMYDIKMTWHLPSEEEVKCVQGIVSRFLPPELDRINKFINGSVTLDR
jgi:hypothetical protein